MLVLLTERAGAHRLAPHGFRGGGGRKALRRGVLSGIRVPVPSCPGHGQQGCRGAHVPERHPSLRRREAYDMIVATVGPHVRM